MVIGKKIRRIEVITPEKTVETGYDSRGIRMDVYVEDDDNTVYDVETQASKKWYLGKRFRYYQSAIDVDIVNKGEDFGKLKNSFIILLLRMIRMAGVGISILLKQYAVGTAV